MVQLSLEEFNNLKFHFWNIKFRFLLEGALLSYDEYQQEMKRQGKNK